MPGWPYPRWIGHRGAGQLAPENTLAAFALGARHGYRMFECDAKLSADGVVFLLHDATLERTTNGQGLAAELDWAALSRLDAGSWHSPAYAGEPLCTLQALARFCLAQGFALNIEIKPTPGLEHATGGVALTNAKLAVDDIGSQEKNTKGYVFGGGLESCVFGNMCVRGEVLRYQWLDQAYTIGGADTGKLGSHDTVARAGLVFKLN